MQKDIINKIIAKKIERIEKEIRETPYHKGTEHHIGLLKAKLAKLRRDLGESTKSSGGGIGYGVKKEGDATCILIGPPSAGKSTLLNAITSASSKVGVYDFTTLSVIPGMLFYKGAKIQIFDVPGLVIGAAGGKGEGKKILSTIRGVDLVILLSDVKRPEIIDQLKKELYQVGIRLNSQPPKITIQKKLRGNIRVLDPFNSFDKETIKQIALEFGMKNGEIAFSEPIDNLDRVIDAFSANRVYLPAIEVLNKSDLIKNKNKSFGNRILISASKKRGLNKLKQAIWQDLGLIRVFLKRQRNQEPDFNQPLILKKGTTIKQAAEIISSELLDQAKEAVIWGSGAKFPAQKVPLSFVLQDRTILYLAR